MKKRDIWISVAIIAAAILLLSLYLQREGHIKIDAGGAVAELELAGGLFNTVTINSGAEPAKVNARTYRPENLRISMQQGSDNWQINSTGPWGKLSTIRVTNNNTTDLRLGPPFLIKPDVRKSGSSVSVNFAIIGQASEKYQNFARKNNRSVPAAKAKIIDEAGNVFASGRFEYG